MAEDPEHPEHPEKPARTEHPIPDLADPEVVAGMIRRVRRDADLSQRELAQLVRVSQSALARWEQGTGTPPVHVLADMLALAGHTLRVTDADGQVRRPMTDSAPRDRQRRRLPAHLDLIDDIDPYTGKPVIRTPRREHRAVYRAWTGVVPDDHPTTAELEELRERKKEVIRERVRSARAARLARAAGLRPPGGAPEG